MDKCERRRPSDHSHITLLVSLSTTARPVWSAVIDKTAGAHKYGWRVGENKLTGPGLSAAPLRLSITDLTGALWKDDTHTHMQTHTQSLNSESETILEPYSSHLLHYQQAEFMLYDMYQELKVIEYCQLLYKSQYKNWFWEEMTDIST